MSTPYPPLDAAVNTPVCELDDETLRRAHPLLDARRASEFSTWLDHELLQLEHRFRANITRHTLRMSLGR